MKVALPCIVCIKPSAVFEEKTATITLRLKHVTDDEYEFTWEGTAHAKSLEPDALALLAEGRTVSVELEAKQVSKIEAATKDQVNATIYVDHKGVRWGIHGKILKGK